MFDGGDYPISRSCRAQSAHGFLEIEAKVVGDIIGWMLGTANVDQNSIATSDPESSGKPGRGNETTGTSPAKRRMV